MLTVGGRVACEQIEAFDHAAGKRVEVSVSNRSGAGSDCGLTSQQLTNLSRVGDGTSGMHQGRLIDDDGVDGGCSQEDECDEAKPRSRATPVRRFGDPKENHDQGNGHRGKGDIEGIIDDGEGDADCGREALGDGGK